MAAGVVTSVDPSDSESIEVCGLDSTREPGSLSSRHVVQKHNVRFERTHAPLFGLCLERRGENQVRFVFTTSSVDVEQKSEGGLRVRGKHGTMYSDLEGFIDGSSISIEKNVCQVKILAANSYSESASVDKWHTVDNVPLMDLEIVDTQENPGAPLNTGDHISNGKLKIKTVQCRFSKGSYRSRKLYRMRTVYGKWHTWPSHSDLDTDDKGNSGNVQETLSDVDTSNLNPSTKNNWQHISIVMQQSNPNVGVGKEDGSSASEAQKVVTCTIYRNGCVDGQISWNSSEGVVPRSSVPLYLAPIHTQGAELGLAQVYAYSQALSHEDVLTDMHLPVLEKNEEYKGANGETDARKGLKRGKYTLFAQNEQK